MSDIAIFLFDGITALDAVGPYEILQRLPGWDLHMVGVRKGEVRTDTGNLGILVDAPIAEHPAPEILVMPGGFGADRVMRDEAVLSWVRRAHETSRFTTSVCTGSLVLAAAGVLKGLRAACHWAQLDRLEEFGAIPTSERVVEQGKVITAAGVSSGIDMALRLAQLVAGDDVAQAIQLSVEYDPQPPFDAGSVAKAPGHVVDTVRKAIAHRRARK